ncbi:MAG: PD-(D/E)XK nuclease family protein, partial [Elusimicrobiota bacterium]
FSAGSEASREAASLLRDHFAPAGDDASLWEECLETVAQLAALDRLPGPVSWDVFLDALEEKFRRAARPAPPANDGVRALNAMDARGESFRVLILLGLEEGAFPRKIREDPFLSDADRSFLQQPGGHWIQPKLAGYDEEKLLFYLAASAASERLVCLFPRSDDAGKVAVPSLYLRELARAAGLDWDAGAAERVPRAPYEKWDGLRPEELSPKEITLQAARAGRGAESFLAAAGGDAPLFSAGRAAVEELKRAGEPGPLDGLAGPSADFARELSRRGLSATALNDYVSCPFRFFALRRLGLRAEEPLARGELDPRLRGKIHHAVLQKFYEDLSAAGHWKTPAADWRPFLERALDETFRVHDWRSLGLYPVLWESFRRRTGLLLRDFAAADLEELSLSGFAPVFFELALGPVPVEDQPVAWQGRLDRVDAAEAGNRFRVVDYKSRWGGGGRDLTKEVRRGAENQPLFYLELAARDPRLGLSRKPDGARYLPVDPGKKTKAEKLAFPAAVWEARRAELLRNAARLTEKLLAGEFPIRPDEERGGVCGLCDFPFLCRKSHPLTRVRAERADVIKIMAQREAPPS